METLYGIVTEYLTGTLEASTSSALFTLTTTIVSGVTAVTTATWAFNHYLSPAKLQLPGPSTDQRQFFTNYISQFRFDRAVALLRAQYGSLYKVPLHNQNLVFVSDASVSEIIFKDYKTFVRNEGTVNAIEWMCEPGGALFGLNGEAWERHRRAMVLGFSNKCLKHLVDCSYRKTIILKQLWTHHTWHPHNIQQARSDTEEWLEVNLHRMFAQLTVDVICMTLFGHDYKTLENSDSDIMKAVPQLVVSVTNRAYTPKWMWRWKLHDHAAGAWAKGTFQSKLNECIASKLATRASGGYHEPTDMIDILLDSGVLGVDEMIGEMFGLVFAGHETTSNTLTILMMLVLKHPQVYQQMQQEIDKVLGDDKPTTLTVGRLSYLECVIKETLRLYPLFTGFGRTCNKSVTMHGTFYPAGTHFWIDMIGHHQDPTYFSNPTTFNPDRWLTASEWLKPYTFVPFFDGAHRCLGERFAIANMRVILARLLRDWDFEPVMDQDLTVKYKGVAQIPNMRVRVKPRRATRAAEVGMESKTVPTVPTTTTTTSETELVREKTCDC